MFRETLWQRNQSVLAVPYKIRKFTGLEHKNLISCAEAPMTVACGNGTGLKWYPYSIAPCFSMTKQAAQNRKQNSEKLVQAETLLKAYMKENSMRCTTERLIVLRELYQSGSHLDADEIFVRLKKKGLSISRATVYHTLDLLLKCHLATKIDLGHKHTHYEKSHGVANHLHIVCEKCGKVVEVTSDELTALLENLCLNNGFELGSFSLQVFGKCSTPECENHPAK